MQDVVRFSVCIKAHDMEPDIPDLQFISSVISGKSFQSLESLFLSLKNRENNA